MDAKYQKFFLGANSCKGFESHFSDCYDARDGWCAYIIKGGPGTGKSSFMRHFASHAIQKGEEVILCPCSSDPESLDGVILPRKKTVLLDGTAPHVVEPSFPGVCEEIINLGEFWDAEKLKKLSLNTCMNCGACTYVCPAKRNISEKNQLAKPFLRDMANKS